MPTYSLRIGTECMIQRSGEVGWRYWYISHADAKQHYTGYVKLHDGIHVILTAAEFRVRARWEDVMPHSGVFTRPKPRKVAEKKPKKKNPGRKYRAKRRRQEPYSPELTAANRHMDSIARTTRTEPE